MKNPLSLFNSISPFSRKKVSGSEDLLYQRLSETSNVKKRTDSLPAILLHSDNDFKNFMEKLSDESRISVFDTLVQVGLIEKTYIVEQDSFGYDKQVTVYKFFHDQYTQYWLAAIYNTKILGYISSNIRNIESVAYKIENILDNSKHAPVLSGALDHWFYNNMSNGERSISDFLIILFNHLAANEAGSVKFYVSSFLYSLLEKNIIEPTKLFQNLFEDGNFQLKQCLADYIQQVWPDVSSACLRSLIESCDDEKDDKILRAVGDIFADLFALEPKKIIQFLDETLHDLDGKALSTLKKGILDNNNFMKYIAFILKFTSKTVITNFSDIDKMVMLREFLRKKFKYIIDAALLSNDKRYYIIKRKLRSVIYRKLEDNGLNQWDQAVGSHGGNNTFFIEDNGLVQRDILYEYYKYVVALHNGDIGLLSLDKEGHFRKTTVQMINYREASIIGYVATVFLATVIKDDRQTLNDISDELIALNSKSSRYFTSLLLSSLAFMNKDLCHTILDIYLKKLLPQIVSSNDYIEYTVYLLDYITVSSINVDIYWEYSRNILDDIYETLTNTHDTEKISIWEDQLPFCCFLPEIKIGTNIISYMIERKFFDKPLWRACALKVLAGMLARSPKILNDLLIKEGIDTAILNEVRPLMNERMLEMKYVKSYQHSWNKFLIEGISSLIKLRYFLTKYVFAGLIQSNSVEEFAKEFRRFVIETARGFLNDHNNDTYYLEISLQQALDETESKRIPGGGKRWVPRAAAQDLPVPN